MVLTMDAWYSKFFSRGTAPKLQKALIKAEQGDAEAQYGLGLMFGNSPGETQDFVQAAQWYLKAANQNHSLAQFNLGIMYAKGQGVALDAVEAARWLQRAADLGDAGAQFNLGLIRHRDSVSGGSVAAESRIEAYKWYHLAAEQGYKGSEAARETVTFTMTHAEVTEANRRATRLAEKIPTPLPHGIPE
jgi:TPR repeat protein